MIKYTRMTAMITMDTVMEVMIIQATIILDITTAMNTKVYQ